MQDFGQQLPKSQNTPNICVKTTLMPSQISTSIGTHTRTSLIVSSEKDSALFCTTDGVVAIEGIRDDAGSSPENVAGQTEGIDLNKTPATKFRRKKHRPKVLKEEKSSKKPKCTASKLSKGKEEKPPAKRKYVRKKTHAGQPPPQQGADSNCRDELKPVRRCLNFDGQYNQEVSNPLGQAQMAELATDPKGYQQSVSSTSEINDQNQSACCAGSINSSIYSTANQMDNAQLLPTDNMHKTLPGDLNISVNKTQNEYANFMNCHVQDFESETNETLVKNTLVEPSAGMPQKNVPDLSNSISLSQSMSANFSEFLLSSCQSSLSQTQMANRVLIDRGMTENPITATQSFQISSVRDIQCFERSCARDTVKTDQMPKRYNHRSTANIEGNLLVEALDKHAAVDNYSWTNTTPCSYIGAALRSDSSHDSSHSNLMDTKREYSASKGAQAVFGANWNHQNNGLTYDPETYKRMRLVDHDYSTSADLSNNRDTNLVSEINFDEFTLADAQKLIVSKKSHASQRMINFDLTQNSMVKTADMVLGHSKLPRTAFRNSTEIPKTQSRIVMQDFTQSSNSLNNLHNENINETLGSHQLQFLGGSMVLGSYAQAELHKHRISSQDSTQNSVSIPPAEVARNISVEHSGSPVIETTLTANNVTLRLEDQLLEASAEVIRASTIATNPSVSNDVLRNENNQLEGSPTIAIKTSEKRKTRGRPRKTLKPSEMPKPRGRPRKEKVIHAVLKAKGDPLLNEDISCACGPHFFGERCRKHFWSNSTMDRSFRFHNSKDDIVRHQQVR